MIEYTESEQKMADIVAKWIVFHGSELDTQKVTPDSMICFNIVKEIGEYLTTNPVDQMLT